MAVTSKSYVVISVLLVAALSPAREMSLSAEVSRGQGYQSTEISSDGPWSAPDAKPKDAEKQTAYDWNLSVSKSSMKSTNATTGLDVTDVTTSGTFGIGLETPNLFTVGLDFSFSSTPDESLVNYGPSLSMGYTSKFSTESDKDFAPKTGIKVTASKQDYVQTFAKGAPGRRLARPQLGTNNITQNAVELSWFVKPFEWGRLKLGGTAYTYSKDVNEFLAYLDVQAARNNTTGLSNAISGFSKSDSSAELDFYFLDTWELDLKYKLSKMQSDGSTSKATKVMLYKDFNDHWRMGLGGQKTESDSANSAADNETIANLNYDF